MKKSYDEFNTNLIDSKEFIIIINENKFILNSLTILDFIDFLKKQLKKNYIPKQLSYNIENLSVNEGLKAYFPHVKSPLLFSEEWFKLGLLYSIKRIK